MAIAHKNGSQNGQVHSSPPSIRDLLKLRNGVQITARLHMLEHDLSPDLTYDNVSKLGFSVFLFLFLLICRTTYKVAIQ